MAWVRMSSTVQGNADHSLDAATCTALQNRLDQAYSDSNIDLHGFMLPNQTSGNYYAVIGPVGTADTYEYQTDLPIMPIFARTQKGGAWRDIKITFEAKTSNTNDDYTVKAYLCPTAETYGLDATGGILGTYPSGTAAVTTTTWTAKTITIQPSLDTYVCGELNGDGTVAGIRIPVWWLHVIVTANGTSDSLWLRGTRIVEDF